MADRKDYFFRQKVTEAELDGGFAELEQAERDIMSDQGLIGVFQNANVAEAGVPDLTVDVDGPAIGYDQQGRRLEFSSTQNSDMSVDENALSTAVGNPGNSKVLSLFWEFDRLLSDPRTDGNGATVFFERDEFFKLNVAQGAEAATGAEVPVALRADQILLADITIDFGQVAILNADIDIVRRQDTFVLTGAASIREGKVGDAMQELLDLLNGGIVYSGGANWADGTPNPPSTVEAQLDKIIDDLAGGAGPAKIGGTDISEGGDVVIDFTTLQTALDDLSQQKHVGVDHVFGVPDILPLNSWAYGLAFRALSTNVTTDRADGWFRMQGSHKVFEVDVYVGEVGGTTNNVTAALKVLNMATGTLGGALDTQVTSGSGGNEVLSFTPAAFPFTLGNDETIIIEFSATGAGGGFRVIRGGRVKARRIS